MIYTISEIKTRRKHICGILLDPVPDYKELGAETDAAGWLALDSEVCDIHRLGSRKEIEESELLSFIDESYTLRAKSRALWYISQNDCSSGEIFDKLCRSFPSQYALRAVERMNELGLLDDVSYAGRKARSLIIEKKCSKRQAMFMLLQKKIDRETAQQAIDAVECDDTETVLGLINKKYINKIGSKEDIKRTVASLQRKGFSYSEIKEALKRVTDEMMYDCSDDCEDL